MRGIRSTANGWHTGRMPLPTCLSAQSINDSRPHLAGLSKFQNKNKPPPLKKKSPVTPLRTWKPASHMLYSIRSCATFPLSFGVLFSHLCACEPSTIRRNPDNRIDNRIEKLVEGELVHINTNGITAYTRINQTHTQISPSVCWKSKTPMLTQWDEYKLYKLYSWNILMQLIKKSTQVWSPPHTHTFIESERELGNHMERKKN